MNGNSALKKAVKKLNIDLVSLVAETAIWASSCVCDRLKRETGDIVWFSDRRRGRNDEKKGSIVDGIKIDDNTYANNAIKQAIGINRNDIKEYDACHIWSDTCYDARYHTAIPNLVLLPRAIAGLSDFLDEVMKALQYHSFELYSWYPKERDKPVKPAHYPANWQEPLGE